LVIDEQWTPDERGISTLATGAGVSLFGRFFGGGLTLLGQVIVARLLGPAAYGLYAIGWTILRTASVAVPLGMDQGIVRFASPERVGDRAVRKGVIVKGLAFAGLAGTMVALAVFLSAPWLARSVFDKPGLEPVLRWFAPGMALAAGLKVAADATRVSQQMQHGALAEEVVQPGSNLLLILVAYGLGYGVAGAAAAGTFSFAVGLVVVGKYLVTLFPELVSRDVPLLTSFPALLRFSIPASLARTFGVTLMWSDRLFVGAFLTEADVGAYQSASVAAGLFGIVLAAFNAIFGPMIAELHQNGKHQDLQELYRVSTKWGIYASLPILLMFLLAPNLVLQGVFGVGYGHAANALRVLSLGQFCLVGVGAVGVILTMAGYPKRWMVASGLALLAVVPLSLRLVPTFGMVGGALAVSISLAALFIWGLFQVKRLLDLWPYDRRFAKGLVASLVAAVAVLAGLRWLPGPDLVKLVGVMSVNLAAFSVCLAVLGFDREDLVIWQTLSSRHRRL